MDIVLASGNPHKHREIAEILGSHTIQAPADLGMTFEYEEVGTTYLENAVGKARTLFARIRRPVLAEDSGISVPALGGAPGVYSARYGTSTGQLDDVGRYRLLLTEMKDITDRRAFYVCCMVLMLEEYRFFVCQETLHGEIGRAPRGAGGFGYDPIFILPERGKTTAEITATEKHSISHRGKAGRRIAEILAALSRTDG